MIEKKIANAIVKSYKDNKKDLKKVENIIEENGFDDCGLTDPSGSFEQGWNNALEWVMKLLEIDPNPTKKSEKITVIHNGVSKKTFKNSEEAINFYVEALDYCDPESSEAGRYYNVLSQLKNGETNCDDSR